MITRNYISTTLPYLKLDDDGNKALDIMEDNMINELPVIDQNQFLGILYNKDIYEYNLFEQKIIDFKNKIYNIYISDNQHIFDALKMMSIYNLSLLPVVNQENTFIGSITCQTIIDKLAKTITISEDGYFLLLIIDKKDFSFAEVSNIIERNNGKVIGMFIDNIDAQNQINVYLKVFSQEIEDIIQSFDKHNYNVKSLNFDDSNIKMYNDRLDNLLKFIKI